MHRIFINGTKYICKILFPVKWMWLKCRVHELYQQVIIISVNFQDHTNPNFIFASTNISWNNISGGGGLSPNREIINWLSFHLHYIVSWLFYLSNRMSWWKFLATGTVDAFSNLFVRLLLASSTSSFSTRMNLIPSIADLQYSNRFCGKNLFGSGSLETIFGYHPFHCPITQLLSMTCCKKLHFALSSFNSCIALYNHQKNTQYFLCSTR